MNAIFKAALAAVVLGQAGAALAGDVTIGSPAPPLKVAKWIKGTPVTIERGKVYVFEFWASW